jgi:hypothetical protein
MLGDGSDPKQRQIQDEAIAERGREAGRDLGTNPIEMISSLASRVLVLVEAVKDDRLLTIPAGVISFANYLPTRTFELTVHSLDIAQALQLELPVVLTDAIAASLELAAQIGALRRDAPELLRLLTGRRTQGGLPRCSLIGRRDESTLRSPKITLMRGISAWCQRNPIVYSEIAGFWCGPLAPI